MVGETNLNPLSTATTSMYLNMVLVLKRSMDVKESLEPGDPMHVDYDTHLDKTPTHRPFVTVAHECLYTTPPAVDMSAFSDTITRTITAAMQNKTSTVDDENPENLQDGLSKMKGESVDIKKESGGSLESRLLTRQELLGSSQLFRNEVKRADDAEARVRELEKEVKALKGEK
ncbi:Hypothetical protein D9617_18g032590 [Elsinoe fawcettii]|nr:Hypothetical protein D9617_18g032590 [Elsinoe fawcettii]